MESRYHRNNCLFPPTHIRTYFIQAGSLVLIYFSLCSSLLSSKPADTPSEVLNEAPLADRSAASFPAADEDSLAHMDGGGKLSPEKIKGRNNPSPPSSQVGSYRVMNLHGAYRLWNQMAAAVYFREAEVAVSAFNALNDKTQRISA